jgi:hypothetical protein
VLQPAPSDVQPALFANVHADDLQVIAVHNELPR